MRIIAGHLKGRRISAPAGSSVRPTSDGLRETLFNVLGPLEGARVLDAFAGTGALGLEALSRGAAAATFVERDPRAIRALNENIRHCGVENACVIIRDDFLQTRSTNETFDLVLLDPPYDADDLQAIVTRGAALVTAAGRLVLEHSRRIASPERAGELERTRVLTSGDSALSFYS